MKNLLKALLGPPAEDELAVRLRREAQACNPEVPLGLRRRVLSSLAQVDRDTPRRSDHRRLAAIVALASLLVATALIWRIHQIISGTPITHAPIVRKPDPIPEPNRGMLPIPTLAYNNLFTPALQGELDDLSSDLSRFRDAVTRVLPAAKSDRRPAPDPNRRTHLPMSMGA